MRARRATVGSGAGARAQVTTGKTMHMMERRMNTLTIKDGSITIHHNTDWSGDAIIIASGKRDGSGITTTREIALRGSVFLSGNYDRQRDCPLTERELRRATALAMYAWVTSKAIEAIEQIDAPGVL